MASGCVHCDYLTRELGTAHGTINKIAARAERAEEAYKELRDALLAEIRGTPCGDDCAGGGYHGCTGCDQRIKVALHGFS